MSKKKIYYEQESQKSYLYTEIKKKANILASISFVDPIWDGSCKHVPCKIPMQKVRMVIWLNICPRLSLQRLTWNKDWVSSGQLFYINKCILFHFFLQDIDPIMFGQVDQVWQFDVLYGSTGISAIVRLWVLDFLGQLAV